MSDMTMPKVEEKLYQNRYIVDESHPHIAIKDKAACVSCEHKACTWCCPAACYTEDGASVTLATDGCLECGTCRVVCQDKQNIAWDYPRGGYGISYKFG